MKRFLSLLSIIFLFGICAQAIEINDERNVVLRGYDGIELPAGTFIQVINLREFSTKYCDETTKVSFAATNDTFMQDMKLIPKGTLFFGFIEKMNEPIVGTNASMVVKITKMQLPDGFQIPMKGYIYTNNKNLIGGGLTEPLVWHKQPHFQQGLGMGTLKFVPGTERKMGEHLTIAAGADLMIVLTSPAWITHTLTN
ncbi:hypothetical protein IJ843_00885 [bacterium]|nr:hypothetical protein [bacterium]